MAIQDFNKPRADSPYHQGYFTPKNPEKYASADKRIIYRSAMELQFCQFCDEEPRVVRWISEPDACKVQYRHPIKKSKFDPTQPRLCTYYPDYYVEIRGQGGQVRGMVIEVKPESMLVPPPKPNPVRATRQQLKNYRFKLAAVVTNAAKCAAMRAWCAARGLKYQFVTETFLKSWAAGKS